MAQQMSLPKLALVALLLLSAGCSDPAPPPKASPKNATEKVQFIFTDLEDRTRVARKEAAMALADLGKAAIPALLAGLKHWNAQVRISAADALSKIGPEAAEAIPTLAGMADDSDPMVRLIAISSLGGIGPKAIPALLDLLKNGSRDIHHRYNAAAALGRIGKPAIPTLLLMLKDGDRELRIDSTVALGIMGREARAAVPALSEAAEGDRDRDVRLGALNALQKIGAE